MKKRMCLLLALLMLLSLFAGCGQPGAEDPAAQGTPADIEQLAQNTPPRRAEELVPRLNAELKARNIPLEFIYQDEYVYQNWGSEDGTLVDYRYALYQAAFTDSGAPVTTETFDLSVNYKDTPADPMTSLQIWVAHEATDREREMHRTVCAIAAQLCDEQMSKEKVGELFAAEPAPTQYITNTGSFDSFTCKYDTYGGTDSENDYSVVLCQSADLTHTVSRRLSSEEEWYELHFAPAEELLADRYIFAPSVVELESGINENLSAMGIPVECTLHPYCNYGRWRAEFRFTTLDDPDYSYPKPDNIEYMETPEDIEAAFNQYFITVDLQVDAMDPVSKDAPVRLIDLYCIDYASRGEDYPVFCQSFSQALMQAICVICDADSVEADLKALYAAEPTEGYFMGGAPLRTLEKDHYTLELSDLSDDQDGRTLLRVTYPVIQYGWFDTDGLSGEELLDPALLAYDLRVDGPMVKDGSFNYYQTYSAYVNGINKDWRIYLDRAINDYLMYTCSEVSIGGRVESKSTETYKIYAGYGESEDTLLDHDAYGLLINSDIEVFVYYDTDVEDYYTTPIIESYALEKENILRIPIAVCLLLDEGMTEEEAVKLHTHEVPYDYVTEDGVRVTVYGPPDRDVVHLLEEIPETGENYYFCMTRGWFDFAYGHLKEYLEN